MDWLYAILGATGGVVFLALTVSFICFIRVFYSRNARRELREGEYEIPDGEVYRPFVDVMIEWVKMTRALKHERFEIKSDDGLTLRAKYYECDPDGPIEIMFHGYRGSAERDLSGGVERCFALGRNAFIVHQRASIGSDGHVITFGIKEHRDCVRWCEFVSEHFGKKRELILTGISMGAATVTMASSEKLPENVRCILADCGYTSPEEIIKKVIRDMKLPPKLLYPFVRLGAIIFGGFDPNAKSSTEALRHTKIPVIFIHGDNDDFVPADMSRSLYDACQSKKALVFIEGAGHGLAYPVNKEKYLTALREFEAVWREDNAAAKK